MRATVISVDDVDNDGMQRVEIFVSVSGGISGIREAWVDTAQYPQLANLKPDDSLQFATLTRSADYPDRELIIA